MYSTHVIQVIIPSHRFRFSEWISIIFPLYLVSLIAKSVENSSHHWISDFTVNAFVQLLYTTVLIFIIGKSLNFSFSFSLPYFTFIVTKEKKYYRSTYVCYVWCKNYAVNINHRKSSNECRSFNFTVSKEL